MNEIYQKHDYYGLALDPIHVGTGGYRIGRVDNTILRDAGTNIPKIPATSIAGVTRAFSAMCHQGSSVSGKYSGENGKSCAGKGGDKGDGHCGESDCPICTTFGFSKNGKSFQGLAQFTDAMILFFPVNTMIGPVWVTSPGSLAMAAGDFCSTPIDENSATVSSSLHTSLPGINNEKKINLGWLFFEAKNDANLDTSFLDFFTKWNKSEGWKGIIKDKIVIIDDKHFANLVNSNLEVRTSVSIDPKTGAAESGALFTYEAIPRGTIFSFQVTISNPKFFEVPKDIF